MQTNYKDLRLTIDEHYGICVHFDHKENNFMAQLQIVPVDGRRKKAQPLIDMTPMVDLGFLLITFFIFTSALSEPTVMKLLMPKESNDVIDVPESKGITALLMGDGNVIAYEGLLENAVEQGKLVHTNLDVQTGLGAFIRQKQQRMGHQKEKLFYIIKPLNSASYKDVVNALDEAAINGVERFAITEPLKEEKAYGQEK